MFQFLFSFHILTFEDNCFLVSIQLTHRLFEVPQSRIFEVTFFNCRFGVIGSEFIVFFSIETRFIFDLLFKRLVSSFFIDVLLQIFPLLLVSQMSLLNLSADKSLVLGDQIEWQCWGDHDVGPSGGFENLDMVEHLSVSDSTYCLIRLLLSLQHVCIFRFIITERKIIASIRSNFIGNLLLVRKKSWPHHAIILEVGINDFAHILR